jgi:hypothetical protein
VPAWQYIIARVQQEYPETVFFLEGLGGSWDATEALLTEGGMQWAYSELFQNYSGREVAAYLDYAHRQSGRVGLYVHYSETHDNPRLAARSAKSTHPPADFKPDPRGRCPKPALRIVQRQRRIDSPRRRMAGHRKSVHSTGLAGVRENIVAELA